MQGRRLGAVAPNQRSQQQQFLSVHYATGQKAPAAPIASSKDAEVASEKLPSHKTANKLLVNKN